MHSNNSGPTYHQHHQHHHGPPIAAVTFESPRKEGSRLELRGRVAFRPRLLYSTILVWSSLTCGKFTAPLLQQLSPKFTDGMIGLTFALQYAIVACLASWGGSVSDAQERVSAAWGWGRLKVLCLALTLGTVAFVGHGVPEWVMTNANTDIFQENSNMELIWHISMRCIYAVSLGVVAPCLDGLALAHLNCIDGASTIDFGKERMYGAIWWGAGSLFAGIGIDYYGFEFLYAFLAISTLACYISMGVYFWGLSRDTTGVFEFQGDQDEREGEDENNLDYQYEDATGTNSEHATGDNGDGDVLSNWKLILLICKKGYGKALLFFVFTLSMGIAVVDNLSFIFFDTLGASHTMDGWTVVFTVIVETPVFYVAPVLLKRYGPGRLLIAAGISYIIRVIGYTLVPNGKMSIVLMLEMFHGISYAGSKAGSVEFISRMVPEGHEASGQGILIFITYFGIVAGLVIAGWIQGNLGAHVMFRTMALIVSIGITVLLMAELFSEKPTNDPEVCDKKERCRFDEQCNLIKSDSCASSASEFADHSTERYIKNLKYDSLNKYVKDW